MTDLDEIFKALSKSAFRNKFHLQGKDIIYLRSKGYQQLSFMPENLSQSVWHQQSFKMMENKPLTGASCFCCATCNSMLLSRLSGKMA